MRKTKPKKRILLPDPKFNDALVTRFINNMMLQGKKTVSSTIFYDAIAIVSEKTGEDGLEVWKKALSNVTPQVEVKSRRIGGATFQIPQEIRSDKKIVMAIRWMIAFSRKRNEKGMARKLASEIMQAYKEEGSTFKRKEDTHRMAEANKAFSHFRF
ncbi:MAG: 30S ribosomal protein S7 [Bacteroidetes bacterium]|nr:30S ribosomal protein S7 [Bacteroidota bacterium]MBU1720684.1 30S ribosomal protein S7 [Bacteroidota bacterium]